jgi:hypothetical protein
MFSEDQILTIRMLYLEGSTQQELAAQFQVGQPLISKIVRGVAYDRFGLPESIRLCCDCKKPLETSKRRCKECHKKWQHIYFKQWYEQQKHK